MSSSLSAPNLLFYIGRSLNKNVVVFCYNKNGKTLDKNSPLNVYWIMREKEGNPREEITFMESKMAYGHKIVDVNDKECYFTTSALPNETLQIKLNPEGKYRCYYIFEQKEYILKKVFVETDESGMIPKVKYIELYLQDPMTDEIVKKIKHNDQT